MFFLGLFSAMYPWVIHGIGSFGSSGRCAWLTIPLSSIVYHMYYKEIVSPFHEFFDGLVSFVVCKIVSNTRYILMFCTFVDGVVSYHVL